MSFSNNATVRAYLLFGILLGLKIFTRMLNALPGMNDFSQPSLRPFAQSAGPLLPVRSIIDHDDLLVKSRWHLPLSCTAVCRFLPEAAKIAAHTSASGAMFAGSHLNESVTALFLTSCHDLVRFLLNKSWPKQRRGQE